MQAGRSLAGRVLAPIVAGVAVVCGGLVLLVVVARVPQRVFHWWGCDSSSTGAPSWSPAGTRIVFGMKASCDSELFVVDPSGTTPHRLAETRSHDHLPAWSPTGKAIAFVGAHGIYTMRPDGTQRRRISRLSSDFGVAWSPDGGQIAFTHGYLPLAGGDLQTSLYVMASNGAHVQRIIKHSVEPGTPGWSPDGKRLAVAGYNGIYVVALAARKLERVYSEQFGFNPVAPAWSPDGRTVSFVDEDGVKLVDVARRRLRGTIAIKGGTFGDATSWTRTGRLAFSLSAGKAPGIYVSDLPRARPHRLVAF